MTEKSSIVRMAQLFRNVSIKRLWKETRKDKRILLIDLAILTAAFFLFFTDEKNFFFNLIFVLLIYGAFYWSLLAFVFRASFWVTGVTILMLIQVFYGSMSKEELFELPILTFILLMVFGIARKRINSENALSLMRSLFLLTYKQ